MFWRRFELEIEMFSNEISKEEDDECNWSDNPRRKHAYILERTLLHSDWLIKLCQLPPCVRSFSWNDEWTQSVLCVFFSVLKRTNAQLRWRFALVTCDRRAPTNRCVCLSGFDAEQPQEREEARLQLNNSHQRRSLVNFQATDDGQFLSQTSTSHLFISLTFNCQRRFRRKLSSARESMLKYRNSD